MAIITFLDGEGGDAEKKIGRIEKRATTKFNVKKKKESLPEE